MADDDKEKDDKKGTLAIDAVENVPFDRDR